MNGANGQMFGVRSIPNTTELFLYKGAMPA